MQVQQMHIIIKLTTKTRNISKWRDKSRVREGEAEKERGRNTDIHILLYTLIGVHKERRRASQGSERTIL